MTDLTAPRVTGQVPVTYHQFWIASEDSLRDFDAGSNGLVAVVGAQANRGAVIITGVAGGDVAVTVEVRSGAPSEPDPESWEDIVEISLPAGSSALQVAALMADVDTDFPALSPDPPRPTRVRVHARGRDTNPDFVVSENTDEAYLLQAWPAPVAADTVIKATDDCGRAWRENA